MSEVPSVATTTIAVGGDHGEADLGRGGAVALAVAAALGAWAAIAVPLAIGLAAPAAGVWLRRPVVVVLGVGLLASALGHRAIAGLAPVDPGRFRGEVELVTDPRPLGIAGWRAEVRLRSGQRVRATGYGAGAVTLSRAGAGERILVEGGLQPIERRSAWTDSRHLVGTLAVERVGPVSSGSPLVRAAGAIRAAITGGGEAVPERLRALYLGLVIGDDRFQPPAQQAAFRVAGLSHLLAVSGQNVAFVLLVAGPLLRRLSTWPRFAVIVSVLVLFATVTRYEPSVLRATATAGLVAWSVAVGRPNRGLRILALAVAGLLLVDPLLIRSVGFQLSVAASAGILVLGPSIERSLRGPRWLREPLAVTLGAQLAVLPLLSVVFGPVSVVSVPANVVVSWAAALVMTSGLTVGVVSGWLPGPVAQLVQLPVTASLWWIDAVARLAASVPAPRISAALVVPLALALALAWARWSPWVRRAALVAVAGVLVVGSARPSSLDAGELSGARWCPGGDAGLGVLVVHDGRRIQALLEELLERGITDVDVVVVESTSRADGAAAAQLDDLVGVGVVLAPPQHQIRGARRVTSPLAVPGAGGSVVIEVEGDRSLSVGAC